MKYYVFAIPLSILVFAFVVWRYLYLIDTFNQLDVMWKDSVSPTIVAGWIKILVVGFPISLISLILSLASKKSKERHFKLSMLLSLIAITLSVIPLWLFLYI